MAYQHTPTTLLAWEALADNRGIQINPALIEAVNKFNSQTISGSIQNRLSTQPELSDEIIDEIKKLPAFMSGANQEYNNLPQAILDRANTVFGSSYGEFLSRFNAAEAASLIAYPDYEVIGSLSGKSFSDLGFNINSFDDFVTGGVTDQFDPDLLPNLLADLSRWGTLFIFRDLSNFHTASQVCQNLLEQGLGYIFSLEARINALRIDLTDPSIESENILTALLRLVKGSDLKDILRITNFTFPSNSITSLADVLKAENVLTQPARAAVKNGASLKDLSNALVNVGGNFTYAQDVVDFYSQLDLTAVEVQIDRPLPAQLENNLLTKIQAGTGPNRSVWMLDILGSVAGYKYADLISDCNLINKDIDSFTVIQSYKQAISLNTPNINALQSLRQQINTNTELSAFIDQGNAKFEEILNQFALEKASYEQYSIGNSLALNTQELSQFAKNLQDLGTNAAVSGSILLLNRILSQDSSGHLLKACLQEGHNNRTFARYGINPITVI